MPPFEVDRDPAPVHPSSNLEKWILVQPKSILYTSDTTGPTILVRFDLRMYSSFVAQAGLQTAKARLFSLRSKGG
jgi:hypothetical protein